MARKEDVKQLCNALYKAAQAIQELQETLTGFNYEDDQELNFPVRELEEIERVFQNISSKYYDLEVKYFE